MIYLNERPIKYIVTVPPTYEPSCIKKQLESKKELLSCKKVQLTDIGALATLTPAFTISSFTAHLLYNI